MKEKYRSDITGMEFTPEELDLMGEFVYDPNSDRDRYEQEDDFLMANGLSRNEYQAFMDDMYPPDYDDYDEDDFEGTPFAFDPEAQAEYEKYLQDHDEPITDEMIQDMYVEHLCQVFEESIPSDPQERTVAWAYNMVVMLQQMDQDNPRLGLSAGDAANSARFDRLKDTLVPYLVEVEEDIDPYGFRDMYDSPEEAYSDVKSSLIPTDYQAVLEHYQTFLEEDAEIWLEDGSAENTLQSARALGISLSNNTIDMVNQKLADEMQDYIRSSFESDSRLDGYEAQIDVLTRVLEENGYDLNVNMQNDVPAYLYQEYGAFNPEQLASQMQNEKTSFAVHEQSVFESVYNIKHNYGFDESYWSDEVRGSMPPDYYRYEDKRNGGGNLSGLSKDNPLGMDFTRSAEAIAEEQEQSEKHPSITPEVQPDVTKPSFNDIQDDMKAHRRMPDGYEPEDDDEFENEGRE